MTIPIIATILRVLWLMADMAENTQAARHKFTPLKNRDRGSLKIFMAATLAVPAGVVVGFTKVGHSQTEGNVVGVVGIALMLTGILIRWASIYSLCQYFSRTVTILP